jgi:hypothetical protein
MEPATQEKVVDTTPAAPPDQAQQPAAQKPLPNLEKTTGEKWFKVLRFAVAEAVILTLTAAIAFVAWHGKDKYGPVPNYLKRMQKKFESLIIPASAKDANGEILKEKKNDLGILFGVAAAGTMVTFHGGNLFAPVMKGMQDKREDIVTAINKRWGKPGEVERSHERLKHEAKETWGDVIKGRIAAWLTVFVSFFAGDIIAGTDKEGLRRFEKFTTRVGRKVAGITGGEEGKHIAEMPLRELIESPPKNKSYLFGKILALDVFATTAAIAIWTTISKISAMLRHEKSDMHREVFADAVADAQKSTAAGAPQESNALPVSHMAKLGERPVNYRTLAEREPPAQAASIS